MKQSYKCHRKKKLLKLSAFYTERKSFLIRNQITYFSYIHSYLNYANNEWAITYLAKVKTVHYQQKHPARIIFNEDILAHPRPILRCSTI